MKTNYIILSVSKIRSTEKAMLLAVEPSLAHPKPNDVTPHWFPKSQVEAWYAEWDEYMEQWCNMEVMVPAWLANKKGLTGSTYGQNHYVISRVNSAPDHFMTAGEAHRLKMERAECGEA